MDTNNRRDHGSATATEGTAMGPDHAVIAPHVRAADRDLSSIGECKRVAFKCVSEVGWWDTKVILEDLMKGGGPQDADQWTTKWNEKNAAGSCTLVELEGLNGSKCNFLIDTGWDPEYMAERFKATGVDKMLERGEIDFLYMTHEHLDHLWGLEATLRINPEIRILIPESFSAVAESGSSLGRNFRPRGPRTP